MILNARQCRSFGYPSYFTAHYTEKSVLLYQQLSPSGLQRGLYDVISLVTVFGFFSKCEHSSQTKCFFSSFSCARSIEILVDFIESLSLFVKEAFASCGLLQIVIGWLKISLSLCFYLFRLYFCLSLIFIFVIFIFFLLSIFIFLSFLSYLSFLIFIFSCFFLSLFFLSLFSDLSFLRLCFIFIFHLLFSSLFFRFWSRSTFFSISQFLLSKLALFVAKCY